MKNARIYLIVVSLVSHDFAQYTSLPDRPASQNEFFVKARILKVVNEQTQEIDGYNTLTLTLKV